MLLPRSLGLNLSYVSCVFLYPNHQFCCVTTLVLHTWTNHVEIHYHFIHERLMHHTLKIQYTSSIDQLVNAMTKALPSSHLYNLQCKLIVLPKPLNLRGDVKPI